MDLSNISNIPNKIILEDDYLFQFITIKDENIFKKNVVQLSIDKQLKKLTKGLQYIQQRICEQICTNHEELFNQVTWIENLETVINEIMSQIQNLQSAIELLKSKTMDLFIKIQTQVTIINRLHAICDLLRKIMRTQSLTLLALNKENILSSTVIFEICELIKDENLKEIPFLTKDLIKLTNLYEKNSLV